MIIQGNGLKDNFIGKDEGGQMKSKKMLIALYDPIFGLFGSLLKLY